MDQYLTKAREQGRAQDELRFNLLQVYVTFKGKLSRWLDRVWAQEGCLHGSLSLTSYLTAAAKKTELSQTFSDISQRNENIFNCAGKIKREVDSPLGVVT